MIYYVNIGVDTTGYDGLSKLSPLGYNEFVTFVNDITHATDIFRLRGYRDLTSDLNIPYANRIEKWDGFEKDPWRIGNTGTTRNIIFNNGINIDSGIITNASIYLSEFCVLTSCYCYSTFVEMQANSNISFKGCTVYDITNVWDAQSSVVSSFIDSIVVADTSVGAFGELILKYTAIGGSKQAINLLGFWTPNTDNGKNLFNWDSSFVQWPTEAHSVTEESLDIPTIYRSGSNVYTGYELDLFGNQRGGIGAVAPITIIGTSQGSLFRITGDNANLITANTVGEGIV